MLVECKPYKEANPTPPQVIVVDDDDGVREALSFLFQSVGLLVTSYGSTRAFLAADLPDCPSCLVLDVRMPEESGLELQAKLNARGDRTPIIFITGHADVPMTVRAMRLGAVNFLPKPFRDQELLDAVWEAIRSDSDRRRSEMGLSELRKLAEQLTPRELHVLKLVDRGLLNKQIAFELGLAEVTVKMHRSNAFKKLRATTATDLIQKVRTLDIR